MNTTGICSFFMRKHGRPSVALALVFLLIALIIGFKGVSMKLKIVALAISVEKLIFTISFDVSQ